MPKYNEGPAFTTLPTQDVMVETPNGVASANNGSGGGVGGFDPFPSKRSKPASTVRGMRWTGNRSGE